MNKLLMFLLGLACVGDIISQPEYVSINKSLKANWLEYDFGTVKVGNKMECDLLLNNISDNILKIQTIVPGCSCITLRCANKIIWPL